MEYCLEPPSPLRTILQSCAPAARFPRVLDLGCGDSTLCREMARDGYLAVGTDVAASAGAAQHALFAGVPPPLAHVHACGGVTLCTPVALCTCGPVYLCTCVHGVTLCAHMHMHMHMHMCMCNIEALLSVAEWAPRQQNQGPDLGAGQP